MLPKLFDLSGKVAIVTGASSGLGVVFSRALAGAGADVVVAARRADLLEKTAREIEGLGRRALAVPTDVTRPAEVDNLVSQTISKLGKVDILVNNAGTSRAVPAEVQTLERFRKVLEVSLIGAFAVAQRAGREMLRQRSGRIINVASVFAAVGSGPRIPTDAYTTAKSGLVGLTRELALQWATRGVTVNAIAPGFFPTAMTEPVVNNPDLKGYLLDRTPMGRLGEDADVEGVIVFLASEASRYITGQVIFVDGGWTAA